MAKLYRTLTYFFAPLIALWIFARVARGKEDFGRIGERFGRASKPRPSGKLIWLHAASVGEANSILLFIDTIRARFPSLKLLLTTGTVTSARLMQMRLPKDVIHQYAPIDTPQAARRFVSHWKPSMVFFIESEFWPNLISEANALECFMGVINARMSERSFASWKKYPAMIAGMLSCFDLIFAQSDADADRLRILGARNVLSVGNVKYDAGVLPCNEHDLLTLKNATFGRMLWLAASTHNGEEKMVAEAHSLIAATKPGLLTVIVPRHPARAGDIARMLERYGAVAQRSQKNPITPQTAFYLADTIGELGLFYRLCEIAFMGGSLVKHGGQNPLEPARLSCGITSGPHTHNFADTYAEMEKIGACLRVKNTADLAGTIGMLLKDSDQLYAMQKTAKAWLDDKSGAVNRVFGILEPALQLVA